MLAKPLGLPHEPTRSEKFVLVVDDEPTVRLLLETTLKGGPYRMLTASDGEEALAIARRYLPSVIFMDVSMPRLDGFETCRRLKSDPTTRDIRIIMLTAKAQDEDRARGAQVGVDAYVTKPFSPLDLLRRLDAYLTD